MDKIIAMCGLACDECEAYIATQKNDDKMKQKVVEAWSSEEWQLKLEDIDCDGCIAGKRLHKFCFECDVRACGLEKGVKNCAYCNDFSCEKLENHLRDLSTSSAQKAKANLEEIKKSQS